MENDGKRRMLYIAKILYEETDENHELSTSQLAWLLKDRYDIDAHRTTIGSDIDLLAEFGFEVEVRKSSQNRYRMVNRAFETAELKVLVDAVASAKFISDRKTAVLTGKLERLASKYEAETLKRNVCVEGRKTTNEGLFYTVDAINEAINRRRKIRFQYVHYSRNKEVRLNRQGAYFVLSPYSLVWNGEYYYVIGFSEMHNEVTSFRLDRIFRVPDILEDAPAVQTGGFDLQNYVSTMFRMYDAERERVTLACEYKTMTAVVDKFGTDVEIVMLPDDRFFAYVDVAVSHVLYSWVFGFGGDVRIAAPASAKEDYKEFVTRVYERLNG